MLDELFECLTTGSVLLIFFNQFSSYYFRGDLSIVNILPKNTAELFRIFSWLFFMPLDKRSSRPR